MKNLTAQEMAKSLFNEGLVIGIGSRYKAKMYANKVIDRILQFLELDDKYYDCCSNANSIWPIFYENVKQEIDKL